MVKDLVLFNHTRQTKPFLIIHAKLKTEFMSTVPDFISREEKILEDMDKKEIR